MTVKPNHSLNLRIISAVVLMPLVLWCLIYGGWLFLAMIGIALGISFKEWTRMARLSRRPLVDGLIGLFYITGCFMAFVYLRMHHSDHGAGYALCLLLCVWATDTGAYFTGKAIGGPKMAPSISPNKTISGLFGGISSSVAVVFVYAHYLGPYLAGVFGEDMNLTQGLSLPVIVALGVIIAISDQIGDLLISKEKRKVGVKDTGALIPGHGGLLDRIDGLLMSAPVFLLGLEALVR